MYQNKYNIQKVMLLYLGDYTKSYYLREISYVTKLPLRTVQNILRHLEKANILKSKINGKNKYFRLNLDNIETKLYLLQAEIYKTEIFLDKHPVFKTFLKDIKTNDPIIIFGSFAKFTEKKSSDLDLLIIKMEKHKLPLHLLPYKTHEIVISEENFKKALEKQEALIKEIEQKHVILNNHSFYVNLMWSHNGK